jgi:hypothetical protein
MTCPRSPLWGLATSFVTGARFVYRWAASAMVTARSPTRSRTVWIYTAATIDRRSVAMGW